MVFISLNITLQESFNTVFKSVFYKLWSRTIPSWLIHFNDMCSRQTLFKIGYIWTNKLPPFKLFIDIQVAVKLLNDEFFSISLFQFYSVNKYTTFQSFSASQFNRHTLNNVLNVVYNMPTMNTRAI